MKQRGEKTVRLAVLKARLSEYIRAVRRGHTVTVCDRDTPVARLVPYEPKAEGLTIRRAIDSLQDVELPQPLVGEVDSLAALMEERQSVR